HKTSQIFDSYKEVAASEIVCLFNSLELLEVAVCCGSAKNLLGLRYDSKIRIDIK
ncbi:MAG: SAM-dependent chlorinase/fluorinase, partial [Bacteroidales bacterium]|nr:SAM-dependent chlorinase/fluorinase [Bacteroidales bacterium]